MVLNGWRVGTACPTLLVLTPGSAGYIKDIVACVTGFVGAVHPSNTLLTLYVELMLL